MIFLKTFVLGHFVPRRYLGVFSSYNLHIFLYLGIFIFCVGVQYKVSLSLVRLPYSSDFCTMCCTPSPLYYIFVCVCVFLVLVLCFLFRTVFSFTVHVLLHTTGVWYVPVVVCFVPIVFCICGCIIILFYYGYYFFCMGVFRWYSRVVRFVFRLFCCTVCFVLCFVVPRLFLYLGVVLCIFIFYFNFSKWCVPSACILSYFF